MLIFILIRILRPLQEKILFRYCFNEIYEELSKLESVRYSVEIEAVLFDTKSTIIIRKNAQNTGYGIEELQRLYLKTSVADNFVRDNTSKCDTGSAQRKLVKRKGCR